ncbi:MAG: NAD(P)/FAD-dependent oxidoreductase [Desulfobacteraceae bacterium]|nr:NAD(P)/FAD-dependent oxidoreductase [Desulfobacteraceae bacterium]
MTTPDIIIIGAGASGLMCAIEAGNRGRSVLILDHAKKAGQKILMSGGGRCNFTNLSVSAANYISRNPHFSKSALSRFTQWDFLAKIEQHKIPFHERDHGQLFCDNSAKEILTMLLSECDRANVKLMLNTEVTGVAREEGKDFIVTTPRGEFKSPSLVVATGGLSIPGVGATPFGYKIAEQFGIKVWPPCPGLVPFTLQPRDKERLATLSGISVDAVVTCCRHSFRENLLFTHRGLSGPVILQISSHWQPGETITIDLLPGTDLVSLLKKAQQEHPKQQVKSMLVTLLPKRLVAAIVEKELGEAQLNSVSHARFNALGASLKQWEVKPGGTEGYRTAEVTVGGVDCDAVSSKTMEARKVPGLYFIGEVLDVTGWLGGYNLQWAWSSGWVAGQFA